MASNTAFSDSMDSKKLCAYLKAQGMVDTDVKLIAGGKYTGKSILLLDKDNLKRLSLSNGGLLILEKFLREENRTTLKPASEYEEYVSFGLGYGVDATEPSPLRGKHGKVRNVLPNMKNIEETSKNEKKAYSDSISSISNFNAKVSLAVSNLVAEALPCSIEGEFTREMSNEMTAKGNKKTTRIVSFKPYGSGEYGTEDSHFEEQLCTSICEKVKGIPQTAESTSQCVEDYLKEDYDKRFEKVWEETHRFIKNEKLTHYISSISLGAAEYSMYMKTKKSIGAGVKGTGGKAAKASAGVSTQQSEEKSNQRDQHLGGALDTVKRGEGEAVIGFEILPVYMLVRHENIKKVLQKAVQHYLLRESGPFYIKCGNKYDNYLQVTVVNDKNVLIATNKKEEADFFFVEKSIHDGEYCIAFYNSVDFQNKSTPMYLVPKIKNITGTDKGPLQIGGGRAGKFTLRHAKKPKKELSLSTWEMEVLYVKVAPRKLWRSTYFGLNEKTKMSMCCKGRSSERMNTTWLQYKLERIPDQESSRMTVYRAPGDKTKKKKQLVEYPANVEDEEEFNYADEFDQVSSGEEN